MECFYHAADIFFVVFHTGLTLFNALGWILRKTRRLNLATLGLTGASWFILGLFYGIGFCPLTQWHFEILEKLGDTNLPSSYIQYLVHRISGVMFETELVDKVNGVVFFAALVLSVVLNIYDRKK